MEAIENKKAYFDYQIIDTYEAGIVLEGFEAKSAQLGRAHLAGSFAKVYTGEVWLLNATIDPFQERNTPKGYDKQRSRKLLLKRAEIKELIGKTQEKGLTLVPLKMYTKAGKVKVLLGLARSKNTVDKRETIRKRDVERSLRRNMS
jgi:SsrA-binding protein